MYRQLIRESMVRQGLIGAADPRHVEAWMRSENGTLDRLSREEFDREVRVAVECSREARSELSDQLAASYGIF